MEGDAESQAGVLPTQKKSSLLPWMIGGVAYLLILLGIVSAIAVTIFKTDMHVVDTATICPDGHNLVEFWTRDPSYYCNVCGDPQRRGAHMFGCRKCNWDKCEKCATSP